MGRLVSIKRNVNWPWPGEAVARRPIYLSIYLKSQDYGDVGAEAQQGRLTM